MNSFKNKKILIFGLGLNQGGVGSAQFFAKQGAIVKITDLKSAEILQPSIDALKDFPDITYTLGEHKNEDIDWADLIIKNPGVKPGNPYIEYALQNKKAVETDMGIFLQQIKKEQLIGITGTKGKSTTSSLIYTALKAGGKKTVLAGNIGKSVLDTLDQIQEDTLVVLELSSFQLEAFDQHQMSPKWALITNIFPDHLNYYKSMDEYIQAKRVIAKYQTPEDFLFLKQADTITTDPTFLQNLTAKIIYYSKTDLPPDFHPHLLGEHNLTNIAGAYQVGKTFNLPDESLLQYLADFQGVEFRMQLIKDWNGIKIYNDTTATNPGATIQTLNSLPNSILIAGGMNKNMPYDQLAQTILEKAKAVFFLEGDATDLLKSTIETAAPEKIKGVYNDLEKLLTDVKNFAKVGDNIVFSPGATSFNLFQNEFDRGRKFNTAVEKIFK